MKKIMMGSEILVYPLPIFLIGADVNDKPNFMAAGACGIVNIDPPMISVAVRPHRYTHKGISQNLTFSVNIPSIDLVKETDYCGITSGTKVDKVTACQFKVFYGRLGTAPLIEQCPINLECNVAHTLELDSHTLLSAKLKKPIYQKTASPMGIQMLARLSPLSTRYQPVNTKLLEK